MTNPTPMLAHIWRTQAAGHSHHPTDAQLQAGMDVFDLIQAAQQVVEACGWKVAVHGDMRRSIDLVAIPWTDGAATSTYVRDCICGAVKGKFSESGVPGVNPWIKPHGRREYILVLQDPAVAHLRVYLSIMPRKV